jgi:hypothetical protein
MTSRVTRNVIEVAAGGVATDLLNPGALDHLAPRKVDGPHA